MPDLPENSLLQQRHARPISGDQLEMLGKKAAASWAEESCSLTQAVTRIVKHASAPLSPEQVRRVVEFANTEAYLKEFRKEGAHKVVDFGPDGPANPADVLRDLNDGGGVTVMDSGLGDYRRPPEKTASDEADAVLQEAFRTKTASAEYPEANPFGEVIELRDKLAGAYEHTSAQISGLEVAYMDLSEHLYNQVKQASMDGVALGEIVQAWSTVTDAPAFVKAAFDQFVPRLFNEGVFHTLEEMGGSIAKTAGARYVNVSHPLVDSYNDFCQTLSKLAGLRAQQEELYESYNQATGFLSEVLRKEAGVVGEALNEGEKYISDYLRTNHKMGPASAKALGKVVVKGPIAAGAAAGAIGTGVLGYHAAQDAGDAYNYQREQRKARWAGAGG